MDEQSGSAPDAGAALREEMRDIRYNPANPLHAGYTRGDAAVLKQVDDRYSAVYHVTGQKEIGDEVPVVAAPPTDGETAAHVPPAPAGVAWSPEGAKALGEAVRELEVSQTEAADLTKYCVSRWQEAEAGATLPDPAATEATLRAECASRNETYEEFGYRAALAVMRLPQRIQDVLLHPALGNDPRIIRELAARGRGKQIEIV